LRGPLRSGRWGGEGGERREEEEKGCGGARKVVCLGARAGSNFSLMLATFTE